MSTSIHNSTDYVDIPSRSINGMTPKADKRNVDICLREESIREFWIAAIRAIQSDMYGDVDGRVYTSDGIGVFLGPWDIDILHHFEPISELRYDVDFGEYETVYAGDDESFVVVGAYDCDNDVELHGVVRLLNQYYKDHENILLNL